MTGDYHDDSEAASQILDGYIDPIAQAVQDGTSDYAARLAQAIAEVASGIAMRTFMANAALKEVDNGEFFQRRIVQPKQRLAEILRETGQVPPEASSSRPVRPA
jgi:hypothetical protein